jgi:hypothetical protein
MVKEFYVLDGYAAFAETKIEGDGWGKREF